MSAQAGLCRTWSETQFFFAHAKAFIFLPDELDYRHFGNVEDGVDMRAEVGLLTRNIKIQGVMARGCPPNNENCDEFEYHDTYGAHVKVGQATIAFNILLSSQNIKLQKK